MIELYSNYLVEEFIKEIIQFQKIVVKFSDDQIKNVHGMIECFSTSSLCSTFSSVEISLKNFVCNTNVLNDSEERSFSVLKESKAI